MKKQNPHSKEVGGSRTGVPPLTRRKGNVNVWLDRDLCTICEICGEGFIQKYLFRYLCLDTTSSLTA